MTMQAIRRKGPFHSIPFTRGADITPGSVVVVGTIAGVDNHGGTNGSAGELDICGTFDVVKITEQVFAAGVTAYWNATADPQSGVAETGAATVTVEDSVLGVVEVAATEDAERVTVHLQQYAVPSS